MTISIFRWADGPYLAFDDSETCRRYTLDACHAQSLLDRLGAHIGSDPDGTLVVDRHAIRDPCRDLTVTDMFLQECDNLFEVMTATAPMLLLSLAEGGTLLLLAVAASSSTELQPPRTRLERLPDPHPPVVPLDILPPSTAPAMPIWMLTSARAEGSEAGSW